MSTRPSKTALRFYMTLKIKKGCVRMAYASCFRASMSSRMVRFLGSCQRTSKSLIKIPTLDGQPSHDLQPSRFFARASAVVAVGYLVVEPSGKTGPLGGRPTRVGDAIRLQPNDGSNAHRN